MALTAKSALAGRRALSKATSPLARVMQAIINRGAGYGSMAGPAGQELQLGPSDWAGDGTKL
ncbi:hypothetical protein [Aquidulcibacter sp.]|uniref:hypothetical protein n=1 Tax=Aquidulcibacter sp. TaxID=2052990 RepID=UPI0028A7D421|nr:hypothetical protein [Aquidulcibacter sp.]